jgi:amino acid adenylation domain-containing protein
VSETAYACLPDLLREATSAGPDRIAAVQGARSLTFRQLWDDGSRLAGCLRELGVAPDDCVGLYVEPSLDLLVGAWGILLAGGAYLPLSPDYPADRLAYMISTSRTRVVFTQPALVAELTRLAPPGTVLVTLADAGHRAAAAPDLTPGNLAYVVFTSGSTGRPKGVMIEHRSIVSQLRWLSTAYQLDRRRTVLQKTPMSFDAAQWEILAPACGSTVVMGEPGVHRDPAGITAAIRRHGVTTLQCVPTLLRALLDGEELPACTSLRQVFCGGEALPAELARDFHAALPDCDLVNLYGPTECTINSSAYTVPRGAALSGTVSIGAPVHGTRYHLLAADRTPVAAGETGELYISGIQLARGYVHRPDLTAERFGPNPFCALPPYDRLYRTGDLGRWNPDGTVQFVGRADNQVKLRGFRVELDEIQLAIQAHDWVRAAAVVLSEDAQQLVAFVELDPKEAALMDQGSPGAHHRSKAGRLQLKAQLSDPGVRDLPGRRAVDLPGRIPGREQRARVFARKTYRFYEGGELSSADILGALRRRPERAARREIGQLDVDTLGAILRWFGQFSSGERLLPKYGYASPGALYATQLHLEIAGIDGLLAGYYYYHPVRHQLVLIRELPAGPPRLRLHFVGRGSAIEAVYRENIREVLEIETGHLVGLFEEILPAYGLDIGSGPDVPAVVGALETTDAYLRSFDIVPAGSAEAPHSVTIYVQVHPGGQVRDLPPGLYEYTGGELRRVGAEIVLRRHVIAINQQAYDRASFGITVLAGGERGWAGYVDLGRTLQHLQLNDANLGFMSAGYSSRTGNDLPSARRINQILRASGPSYFFVGGRVSDTQVRSEGMYEDAVHMKGPTELIKDDLATLLPAFMIPNRIAILDALPLTPNGKVDRQALAGRELAAAPQRPFVPPRTETERRVSAIWTTALKREAASVRDDFFECNGNSMIAVGLVNKLNREFGSDLPLQALIEFPTIEQLARRIDGGSAAPASRLIPLRRTGSGRPVYCWPGLGGYPMNLRPLAGELPLDRPCYGIQAYGIDAGEVPYGTIREMAASDAAIIRRHQPRGPYTLWGYSFGARVAFETAYHLELAGEQVDHLFLIAPGMPSIRATPAGGDPYRDPAFVTILYSVFAGTTSGTGLAQCLAASTDEDSFAACIGRLYRDLEPAQIRRIIRIVRQTYSFEYTFAELAERTIQAPITIFKAAGDDYSFIENSRGYSALPPAVIQLAADHYGVVKRPAELAAAIRLRLGTRQEGEFRAARTYQALPDAA